MRNHLISKKIEFGIKNLNLNKKNYFILNNKENITISNYY